MKIKTTIEQLEKLIAENPQTITLFIERAKYYRDSGRYDLAIADMTRAIRLDPFNSELYETRGYYHRANQEYDAAGEDYAAAFEKSFHVDDDDYYSSLAELCYDKGDYDEAIAYCNHVISLEENDALEENGEYDSIEYDRYSGICACRGLAYLKKRDYDSALDDFLKQPAYTSWGGILENIDIFLDTIDKALRNRDMPATQVVTLCSKLFDNLTEGDPPHFFLCLSHAYQCRAFAYHSMGKQDKAIADFAAAIHWTEDKASAKAALEYALRVLGGWKK